jgi:hypothetical protein
MAFYCSAGSMELKAKMDATTESESGKSKILQDSKAQVDCTKILTVDPKEQEKFADHGWFLFPQKHEDLKKNEPFTSERVTHRDA